MAYLWNQSLPTPLKSHTGPPKSIILNWDSLAIIWFLSLGDQTPSYFSFITIINVSQEAHKVPKSSPPPPNFTASSPSFLIATLSIKCNLKGLLWNENWNVFASGISRRVTIHCARILIAPWQPLEIHDTMAEVVRTGGKGKLHKCTACPIFRLALRAATANIPFPQSKDGLKFLYSGMPSLLFLGFLSAGCCCGTDSRYHILKGRGLKMLHFRVYSNSPCLVIPY